MGKSHAMRQEYDSLRSTQTAKTQVVYLDLNTFGMGELGRLQQTLFQGPEYESYQLGEHLVVFLDSFDQALADIPHLDTWLADQLGRHIHYPSHFRLRIASRTGDWTSRLETDLKSIWTGEPQGAATLEVLEICPLRRRDAVLAAEMRSIDPEQFLTEIRQGEIEPLASRPVTLDLLFKLWEQDQHLPASKALVYEKGLSALCEDERSDRTLRSTSSQRMTIAGRLASAMMFCGHAALWQGQKYETPDGDVLLYDLDGEEHQDAGRFHVDKHLLRETVNATGLFTGQGRDRLGFAHYSFAEFLAAWYLHRSGKDPDRLLTPLRFDKGGRIVPKLRETAAWLASLHRPVMDRLLAEEPAVLLHVDGAALTNADKAHLAQSLLDQISIGELFPHDLPGRALRKLAHPGLAEQLRPWIGDPKRPRQTRDFAMDLARWCETLPLAMELARVALDSEDDYHLRIAAAHAVVWIKDDTALAALKPLALGQAGHDPERRLRNLALHGLWPGHLTAEEFFLEPIDVTAQKGNGALDSDIYGGTFFETLRPEHLPAALAWVRRHPGNYPNFSHRRLLSGILRKAWQWLEEPGVLEDFARTALALLENYSGLFEERGEKVSDDPLAETGKRRQLLRQLLSLIQPNQVGELVYAHPPAARAEDLSWLLDLLEAGLTDVEHRNAAALLHGLLRYDTPVEVLDRVLQRSGVDAEQPDLILRKALSGWTHPWRLKSEWVRRTRDNWLTSREREKKRSNPVLVDPPPCERVSNALEHAERGKWSIWAELAMELTRPHYGWPEKLHEQPGWLEAPPDIQSRIQSVALDFLIQAAPDNDKLFEIDSHTVGEMAGLFAFELLTHTAPAHLTRLTPEHWAKWVPLIMVGLHHSEDWERELLTEAHRQAPEAVLQAALRLVDKRDRREQGLYNLSDLDPIWSPALTEGLLTRFDGPDFKSPSRRAILDHLLQRGEPGARTRARALVSDREDHDLRRHAAAVLYTRDAVASWPILAPLLEEEPEFAKEFIAEAAYESRWLMRDNPDQGLDESQIATLFLWLETHFPAAEDPVHEDVYSPSARDHIKDYRNSLINRLRDAGTWAAVSALERIADALPDRDWLRWTFNKARERAWDTQWRPPSWAELMALLSQPDSHLIRTTEDLWWAVLESLNRLQSDLQGVTPLAPFLWDERSKLPKLEIRLSEFVKHHLSADLNRRGVLINREVEIANWPGKGRGESLDLLVQATSPGERPLEVVIEVKGCWNPGLLTDMKTQLRDRYLVDEGHRYGIYLVGWYGRNGGRAACKQEQVEFAGLLEAQAESLSTGGTHIAAVVLNASLRA